MMDGYKLSRVFWDFAFDNPEKISPNHAAIFFFAIEHCNRLGWKEKFGLPSQMVMDAIGVKKHSTYIRYFRDLVDWGFFKMIQKSSNQYSANIICLANALPKKGEALDKAIMNHAAKHTAKQKEYNKTTKPTKQLNQLNIDFDIFWEQYHQITGKAKTNKDAATKHWKKLTKAEKDKAVEKIQEYFRSLSDVKYCKLARTYLADKNFNDEFQPQSTRPPDRPPPPFLNEIREPLWVPQNSHGKDW